MAVVMSEEGTAPLPSLPGGRRSWRSRRPRPGAGPDGRRRGRLLPYALLVPTLAAVGVGLGYPLVRSEVGGAGGGHTALTPEGERLVGAYRRFHDRVGEAVDLAFREEFGGTTTR